MNHQAQLAERRRQQQARADARARADAQREAERARTAAERAQAAAARATVALRDSAEKEARRLLVESREAEVSAMNAEVTAIYADVDSLLSATLGVDDWVDLESLRVARVDHPAFDPGEYGSPVVEPRPPAYPPQPVWQEPDAPRGMGSIIGGKRRHEDAVARTRAEYEHACQAWQIQVDAMYREFHQRWTTARDAEDRRLEALVGAKARYDEQCRQREREAAESNAELDRLINELAFDMAWAIQEYVGIVLSNSVYPESFPVSHDYRFDLETRELTLTARVPDPTKLPTVKAFRYLKAQDTITETSLPVREQKDRYASAVCQVAVRTLHEIFEADRVGRIRSVSLTVDTTGIVPATGLQATIPLVVVAADRDTFTKFDLARVVPSATLTHLGAATSKNPFDLVAADTSRGVRGRTR